MPSASQCPVGAMDVRWALTASLLLCPPQGKTGGGGGGGGNDVVTLTDNNFEELVLKSDDMWLVEFFAPW